jgi:hypothetical protein
VVINDSHKFKASLLIDIIEDIHGTDGYMSGLTGPNPMEREILEGLKDLGLVDGGKRSPWFESDEDGLQEVYEAALSELYDEEISVDW